ncbi:MAG TPA: hypothetical protein VK501_27185 [Baekduia sp.]|uniref:hypothetical protein n=1 Tax=Baekduia sp. TaxID=2600305 RepID=UPI002B7C5BC0|nr:hypothetical protein [Baekduia sp.]HMJ37620.1 hypothetical protein [Baekduia sp.]
MIDPPLTPDQDPDTDAVGRRIRQASLSIDAPPRLRARVTEQRVRAGHRSGARGVRWWRPAVAAGLAAAVALVLVVAGLTGGDGGGSPSFDDAAQLALARPNAPAPAVDPANTTRVSAQLGGIDFPNYAYAWPKWRTAGTRQDRVGGREAVTVTYRGPKGDVGYTIVDGKPLDEPAGARHVTVGDVRLAVLQRGATTFVTWRRAGHTCVLASRAPGVEAQLVRFAAWA